MWYMLNMVFVCLPQSKITTVWRCRGDNQPGGGAGGWGCHVFCRSQETDRRQHSGSRLHHAVSAAVCRSWLDSPVCLFQSSKERGGWINSRLSCWRALLTAARWHHDLYANLVQTGLVFPACTWGKAEERRGSVKSTTLPACQRRKPCLPLTLMEWVMPRTELAEAGCSGLEIKETVTPAYRSWSEVSNVWHKPTPLPSHTASDWWVMKRPRSGIVWSHGPCVAQWCKTRWNIKFPAENSFIHTEAQQGKYYIIITW